MKSDVELVTTGCELLSGRTVNRHAHTLAGALRPMGYRLTRDTTVPDDLEAIEDAVRTALGRVETVFVSGGLGPTSDDVTRDAVARLLGRGLHHDAEALAAMEVRYQGFNRPVTEITKRQVLVIDGSEVLQNPVGIAPGMRLELDGSRQVFILPGPPREFSGVLEAHILPRLERQTDSGWRLVDRLFLLCGIGESDIAARLEKIGLPVAGIEVGYCAHPGSVEVRLTACERDRERLDRVAADVRALLADFTYAEERIGMEVVVGRLLRARKATLATAESCTGGLIGHRLTTVPGSSEYYLGGVVCYSNESKIRDLGVPREVIESDGAVSDVVVCAMAEGVRARFGADYGVAVSGIAGPDGGSPEKPVGTIWLAVADHDGTVAATRRFPGVREIVRDWSGQMALDLLRRRIMDSRTFRPAPGA